MTIYLDLFILKNFIFNFLIIAICGKILNLKMNLKKYLLASNVGTIFALIALITKNIYISYILKCILGITITITAYPIKTIKNILNETSIFLLTTCFIGGSLVIMNTKINFISQTIGIICSAIMLTIFQNAWQSKRILEELKCEIEIEVENKTFKTNAFIDTGNMLKDSISGESVIFINEERLKNELPEETIQILKSQILQLDEKYFGKIKMLTYKSIDGETKIMTGIKAESVTISYQNIIVKNKNAIIAMSNATFNDCEALIGQNIIEEGQTYGNNVTYKNESKKIME